MWSTLFLGEKSSEVERICVPESPLVEKTPRKAIWLALHSSKKYIFIMLSCWDFVLVTRTFVFLNTN